MKTSLLNTIGQSKILNKHIDRAIKDDAFAAKSLVTIAVAKDVFAYGRRFQTTLKNEEIPEEKRPFVAAMDLMSGAVTAVVQLFVGFNLANPKFQSKLWNAFFKDCKFKDVEAAKKGFSQVLALIGSSVIAERILVPLIATPLAEATKGKMFKGKEENKKSASNAPILSEEKKENSKPKELLPLNLDRKPALNIATEAKKYIKNA